jgi:methylated-DNA-[protein]-cysteine S-methyltransferase
MNLAHDVVPSPVGDLLIVVNSSGALVQLEFTRPGQDTPRVRPAPPCGARDPASCSVVANQLSEYFRGVRHAFELQLALSGTTFQMAVWGQLCRIPYGHTITYGELAARLGDPRLVRAVGGANGANPVAIVVPCHRVIGADGSLVGYGGGLETKRALLKLEGVNLTSRPRQLDLGFET